VVVVVCDRSNSLRENVLKQPQPSTHPVTGLHERVSAGRRPTVLLSPQTLQLGRRLTADTVQLHQRHRANAAATDAAGAILLILVL